MNVVAAASLLFHRPLKLTVLRYVFLSRSMCRRAYKNQQADSAKMSPFVKYGCT
jgi:hypothetical protein